MMVSLPLLCALLFILLWATLLTKGCGQAWNGIGAICDISIALSMPYFVRGIATIPY